jgi:hypothetical protein
MISWRRFADDLDQQVIEAMVREQRSLSTFHPEADERLFDIACSEVFWKRYPVQAMAWACALLQSAEAASRDGGGLGMISADLLTWNVLTEAEEAGEIHALGDVARELYGALGESQAEVARLRAELTRVAPGPRAPGMMYNPRVIL